VAGILLLVGYSVGDELVRQLDMDRLVNFLDPFAIRSIELVTRYWTPAEKNANTLPVAGFIGENRLRWSAGGVWPCSTPAHSCAPPRSLPSRPSASSTCT
jgi:hypothetical protein